MSLEKQVTPRWRAIKSLIAMLRKLIELLTDLVRLVNAVTA